MNFEFPVHSEESLPSRERGLKYMVIPPLPAAVLVAPLAGAWIEIAGAANVTALYTVAPLAGAWIEITIVFASFHAFLSLPSRERGLKLLLAIYSLFL